MKSPMVVRFSARYGWYSQSLVVDIYGMDFQNYDCLFSQALGRMLTSTPSVISTTHVSCSVHWYQFEVGPRTLELVWDDILSPVHKITCRYDASPRISEIVSTQMVQLQRLDSVTVMGEIFQNTDRLSCKLGVHVRVGQFLSYSKIICPLLDLHYGNFSVEISIDGSSFTSQGKAISLFPMTCSFELVPSMGVASGVTLCRIKNLE